MGTRAAGRAARRAAGNATAPGHAPARAAGRRRRRLRTRGSRAMTAIVARPATAPVRWRRRSCCVRSAGSPPRRRHCCPSPRLPRATRSNSCHGQPRTGRPGAAAARDRRPRAHGHQVKHAVGRWRAALREYRTKQKRVGVCSCRAAQTPRWGRMSAWRACAKPVACMHTARLALRSRGAAPPHGCGSARAPADTPGAGPLGPRKQLPPSPTRQRSRAARGRKAAHATAQLRRRCPHHAADARRRCKNDTHWSR